MSAFHPLRSLGTDATLVTMKRVRWPWSIFALLLACGIAAFSVSVDWSAQSWLDIAAYAVSLVGILGVFLYASGRPPSGAAFWRAFRWLFIGVVALQGLVHAIEVAKAYGYSVAGTIAWIITVAVVVGWIYALQWIAMTRLAKEQ